MPRDSQTYVPDHAATLLADAARDGRQAEVTSAISEGVGRPPPRCPMTPATCADSPASYPHGSAW